MTRRTIWHLCKYAAAFALLAFVISSNWAPTGGHGLQETWQKHVVDGQPIRYQYLELATLIALASFLLTFVRWYLLVQAQGLSFTLSSAVRLGMVGLFFNSFLPGAVGGDIIKAAFLAREHRRRTAAVTTVIMDRIFGLWALVCFVALLGSALWAGGFLPPAARMTSVSLIVVSGGIVVVSLLAWGLIGWLPAASTGGFAEWLRRLPKFGGTAAEFWRAVRLYRLRPRTMALVLLLSMISQGGFVVVYYLCVLSLADPDGPPVPYLTEHFLLVPIGMVIQAIPLVPGGYGLGELGFGKLYLWFGCAAETGVLGSLAQRVVNWALGALGYVVYLQMQPCSPPAAARALPGRDVGIATASR